MKNIIPLAMNDNYFISYDIVNNKLRTKIEKTLNNFGIRFQYSVFYCRLETAQQLIEIREQIEIILNENKKLCCDHDSIAIVGGIPTEKVDFVKGSSCIQKRYVIY